MKNNRQEEFTDAHLDQSQLYAFFDLTIALAGDMGIAISLAVTHTLIKSNLTSILGDSPATDDVSISLNVFRLIASCSKGWQIIQKSLENLDYVRALPSSLHQSVIHAFVSSIEKVFGMKPIISPLHFDLRHKLTS